MSDDQKQAGTRDQTVHTPRAAIGRRSLLALGAGALMAAPAIHTASAASARSPVSRALLAFDKMPGTVSYTIQVDKPGRQAFGVNRNGTAQMFVGSAIKTFILTQFLRDVEDGRIKTTEQLTVDDAIRSLDSPTFLNLTGTTSTSAILEAMINHSDNTATDITLKRVGVARVRKMIADARLTTVQIPTNTRYLISYLAGAPYGVDVGWTGVQQIANGKMFGPVRSPMNTVETMKASTSDMVSYYRRVLAGGFIRTDAMRNEFRRISSGADALWQVVPEYTPAFGKGGSINWNNFNCLSLSGQMRLGGVTPVTFSFCVNWPGKPDTAPAVQAKFALAIQNTLAAIAQTYG